MLSTKTLEELAEDILARDVRDALGDVDCYENTPTEELDTTTPDHLSRKYLAPEIDHALSKVDLRTEHLGLSVRVEKIEMSVQGHGLSIILLLVLLAYKALGEGSVGSLLRHLLGH